MLLIISWLLCGIVAVIGIREPAAVGAFAGALTQTTFGAVGWFFMGIVTAFLLICLFLAFSRFGKLRLGRDDEEPEFSTLSWLSMLFAAGMGVGLLFWAVAEPLLHFSSPPLGTGGTPAAARQAMSLTIFHWGFHAWAIYAMAALVLAFFVFRKGAAYLPGSPIRAAFTAPWARPLATLADFVGVLAVALGVAGSLGMGIYQIQTGLHEFAGTPLDARWMSLVILSVMVVAYMISATTSLDKGIRILSNVNMSVAICLMLFLLIVGPTGKLLGGFLTATGDYASQLVVMSFRLFPFRDLDGWLREWTLNYFVFWIAWAPFVGIFIARISRGRTIREFILGVLLVPTVFSILWFAIFGGTAIHEELAGAGGIAEVVGEDVTAALFFMYDRLPLSQVLGGVSVLLVATFLVTSADSATFVLGMLTSGGSLDPPRSSKIVWGLFLAALAAAFCFTRSIDAMRAMVVAGAIPFTLILCIQVTALLRGLRTETIQDQEPEDDEEPEDKLEPEEETA